MWMGTSYQDHNKVKMITDGLYEQVSSHIRDAVHINEEEITYCLVDVDKEGQIRGTYCSSKNMYEIINLQKEYFDNTDAHISVLYKGKNYWMEMLISEYLCSDVLERGKK